MKRKQMMLIRFLKQVNRKIKSAFFSYTKKVVLVNDIKIHNKMPAKKVESFTSFFYKYRYFSFIIICLTLIVIIANTHVKADIAKTDFYSSSCLGSWHNSAQAEGVPDVMPGVVDFTKDNSAYSDQSNQEIFCGNFRGDAPADSVPQKISLKLSWLVTANAVVQTVPTSDANSSSNLNNTPPLQDASGTTSSDSSNSSATPSTDTTTPNINPPTDTTTSTPPTDTPSPVTSFFKNLFGTKAQADDTAPAATDTTPPTTDTTIQTPATDVTPPQTDSSNSDVTPTAPSDTVVNNQTQVVTIPSQNLVDIKYTVDGTNWKELGVVNGDNWKNASFDINDTAISNWDGLAKLQVSVTTLPTDGTAPVVYLDSAYVEVTYENAPPAPPVNLDLPKVSLGDTSGIDIVTGDSDFAISDTPTFVINDPQLSKSDVQQLVKDKKADLVSDPAGTFNDPSKTDAISPATDTTNPTPPTDTLSPVTSFFKNLFSVKTATADTLNTTPQVSDVSIVDSLGQPVDIGVTLATVTIDGIDHQEIRIAKPENQFKPGKYTLKVTLNTSDVAIMSTQDFTWGVLAINMNKTVYQTGESAYLQMGVLTDQGHTICNADLSLNITDPNGIVSNLNTTNGSIVRESQCGPDNYISVPDYYAHYKIPNIPGTYNLKLSAHTLNGTRAINDSIFVVAEVPHFNIERTGPSRIYPYGDAYPMTMRIESDSDWQGVVTEKVPASFEISQPDNSQNYDSVVTSNDGLTKIISWNLSLTAGSQQILGYKFIAPPVSPEFYLLGKIKMLDISSVSSFEELRNWQIASDAGSTCTMTSGTWDGTMNVAQSGHGTATWTGCTGGTGFTPAINDSLQINSGIALTANTATAEVNNVTIANTGSFTQGAGLLIDGSLTVSAGGTFTLGSSSATFTGAVSDSGTINCPSAGNCGNTKTFNGSFTVSTGGVFDVSMASTFGTLIFNAGIVQNSNVSSSFNTGGSETDMPSTGGTISGTGTGNIIFGGNFVGTGAAVPNNYSAGTVTVAGTLSNTSIAQGLNSSLILTSTTPGTVGNFSTNANTVTFTNTCTLPAGTYSSVVLNGSGKTFTTAAITINATLTITAGTLSHANSIFTVTGLTTNSGTISNVTGVAAFNFNGGLTNTGTGAVTLTTSVAPAVAFGGTITQSSSNAIVIGGVATIVGNITGSGAGAINFNSTLTVSSGTTTNTATAVVTVTGTLTCTGIWQQGNGSSLTLGATTAVTTPTNFGATSASNTNTVTFAGTGTMPAPGQGTANHYSNVVIGGTTKTVTTAAVTVDGTLTINPGNTLSHANSIFTVTGLTTNSGTISNVTGVAAFNFNGGLTNTGTGAVTLTTSVAPAVAIGSTLTQSSSNAISFGGAATIVGNITGSGAGAINFNSTLTVSSGTTTNTATAVVTVTGTLTCTGIWQQGNGSSLTLGATTAVTTPTNFGATSASNTNTVTFAGTGTMPAPGQGTANHYSNVVIGGTTKTVTTAAVTVDGTLTINSGDTLSHANSIFTVTGLTTNSGTISNVTGVAAFNFNGGLTNASGGAVTLTTATAPAVAFGGTITQSSSNAIAIGGAATIVGNITGSGTGGITFSSTLTVSSGTTNNTYTGGVVTVTGTLACTGIWLQGSSSSLTLGGATPVSTVANFGASASTNTVTFTATTATMPVPGQVTASTYSNVVINTSGTITTAAITIAGTLNVSAGTLSHANAIFTVTGLTTNSGTISNVTGVAAFNFNGGLTNTGTGAVTLTTSVAPAVAIGSTLTQSSSNAISFGGAATIVGNITGSGAGAINFNSTLTVSSGTTTNTATSLVTVTGLLTLTGNWTQGTNSLLSYGSATLMAGSGTFTASASPNTVTYSAASANITNATYDTLSITSSASTQASGTVTVNTALSGAGTLTQGNGATLNIGGTSAITGLDAATNANTVNYTGGAQTIKDPTAGTAHKYKSLGLSGSGAKTMVSTMTDVLTNLTMSGTCTLTTTGALTVGGTTTVGDGTTLTVGANFAYTNTGALTVGAVASGIFNVTAGNTGTLSFGDITTNSGAVFDLSSAAHVVNLGGNISAGGTTFNTGAGATTFTTTGKSFSGGGNMTIGGPATINTGVVITNNNTGTVTFSSTLTGGSGSSEFDTGLNSYTKFGGTTLSAGILKPSTSANTIEYTYATPACKTPTTNNYYNLTFSGSGAVTCAITTVGGSIVSSGSNTWTTSLTSVGGGITLSGTATMTTGAGVAIAGTLTVGTGTVFTNGVYTCSASSVVITSTGDVVNNGTFTISTALSGTGEFINSTNANLNLGGTNTISVFTTTASGNTVTYTSTSADQTIFATTYNNLTISKAGFTGTLSGSTVVNGTTTLSAGTFDTGNYLFTTGYFSSTNINTRTINMGTNTWVLTGAGATNVWDTSTTTNLAINQSTSTIKLQEATGTGSAKTFASGGHTFNNIWITNPISGTSTGDYIITATNTWNDFKDDNSVAHSIKFVAGTTQTVTTFTVSGSGAGNEISINSTTTGTHTLTKSGSGVISSNYLNIQHSVATPANTWYAGANSINNNSVTTAGSGWVFSASPRYWVGGSASWDGTAGSKWAYTSGGAGGASVPDSTNPVYFDASSGASTVTISSGNTGAGDLIFTGFTGTLAGSTAINISGILTMGSGMTNSYTGDITFNATSGTKNITSNGINFASNIIFDGVGGTWQLADALNIGAGNITLTNGTFNTNGMTVTAGNLSSSNSNTRTLTLGASTINLSGIGGNTLDFTISTGLTFNSNTSTINFSGNGVVNFYGGGQTFYNVNVTSISTFSIYNSNTFYNLTSSGGAGMYLLSNQTLNNNLTISSGAFYPSTYTITGSGTNTISVSSGASLHVGSSTFSGNYASFETISLDPSSSISYDLAGTQTIDHTISYGNLLISGSGTKTLDGVTIMSGQTLISSGTLATGNYNFSTTTITLNGGTFAPGSSTISLTNLGTVFTYSSGVYSNGTSTLKITNTSNNTLKFIGGGQTYDNVYISRGASTGKVYFTGSNTFADLKDDGSVAHSIEFTAGTTTTVTTFTVNGTSGNPIAINSDNGSGSSSTSTHALVKAGGGIIDCNYLAIRHSVATPANTWYAGNNSSNSQSVTTAGSGWIFSGSPRYWVGGTASWDGTAGSKWAYSSGGAGGAPVPTSINPVYFDSSSGSGTVTIASGNTGSYNIDFTGFTGTLSGSSAISISGSLTLATGMTNSYTGAITFNATSGTKTITSNGKSFASAITFDGVGGTWQLADTLTMSGTGTVLTLTNGTFSANSQTVNMTGSSPTIASAFTFYDLTSNVSGTLTLGASQTISHNLTVSSGTFDPSTYTVTGSGTNTLAVSSGATIKASTSTFAGSYASFETITLNGNSTTNYNLAGTQTVDHNVGYGNLTISGSGTKTLDGDTTVVGTTTVTSGTFDAGNYNFTTAYLSSTNTNTRAITMGAGTWTLTGAGATNIWDTSTTTGLTLTPNTSTIKITDTSGSTKYFAGGGKTFNNIWITGTGTGSYVIDGGNTFSDFKDDNTSTHTDSFTAGSTTTIATWNVNGSGSYLTTLNSTSNGSAWNLVDSNGGTNSSTQLYLQDSHASGATWNATESTNVSGNTGWTFSGGCHARTTGNWSTGSNWASCTGAGGVPGTTDNATINSGITITLDTDPTVASVNIVGTLNGSSHTLTLAGTTGTLFTCGGTWNAGTSTVVVTSASGTPILFSGTNTFNNLTINAGVTLSVNTTTTVNGTMTVSSATTNDSTLTVTGALSGASTLTQGSGSTLNLAGTSGITTLDASTNANTINYTGSGQTIKAITYSSLNINGSGTETLGGNITANVAMTLTGGTLDANTRTITLAGSGVVWNYVGGTYTAGTSTIKLTDASGSAKTFAGGGQTYGNIWFTGTGTGSYVIQGSNTFNDFKDDNSVAHTISFTGGTTQTVTTFTVSGSLGHIITLQSTSHPTTWSISDASGTNTVSYVSIEDSTATGGATWNANDGTNIDATGNTGWNLFIPVYSVTMSANGTISYGAIPASGSKNTVTLGTTPVVQNDGNTVEDIKIKGQNTSCPWALSGSIGTDQYKHEFSTNGGSSYTALTTSYQTLVSGISSTSTQNADLRITVPSASSCTTSQSVDVTIMAVAP